MVEKSDLYEQWTVCDVCGNLVKLSNVKKMPVKQEDQFLFLFICSTCWERERSAPEKYVKKAFKILRKWDEDR